MDRLRVLVDTGFDPDVDLRVDPSGAYRWASDKPVLHEICRRYFDERKEDG